MMYNYSANFKLWIPLETRMSSSVLEFGGMQELSCPSICLLQTNYLCNEHEQWHLICSKKQPTAAGTFCIFSYKLIYMVYTSNHIGYFHNVYYTIWSCQQNQITGSLKTRIPMLAAESNTNTLLHVQISDLHSQL